MKVLIVNAGSTSLKCKLYDMPGETVLARCRAERIGDGDKGIFSYEDARGKTEESRGVSITAYGDALRRFLDASREVASLEEIERVGFKTVLAQGYTGVHVLTEDVLEGMRAMLPVAPAHNGPYLAVIAQLRPMLPRALFVGAFETAFHETIPEYRRVYGVPYAWRETYRVRRMGYHGASHEYSAGVVAAMNGGTGRMVSCHLGGSGSLCAIEDGRSVDTSFGLSLQTGLIQSSRVGDMDAFVIPYLIKRGLDMETIETELCKNGGLKGISGISGDLRDVERAMDAGDARAKMAIDAYVNGIVKYIGAFAAEMGGLDCLSFTGGIGENSGRIRAMACEGLGFLGVRLDARKNAANPVNAVISAPEARVKVFVIAADEEAVVARKTMRAAAE